MSIWKWYLKPVEEMEKDVEIAKKQLNKRRIKERMELNQYHLDKINECLTNLRGHYWKPPVKVEVET